MAQKPEQTFLLYMYKRQPETQRVAFFFVLRRCITNVPGTKSGTLPMDCKEIDCKMKTRENEF